MGNLLKVVERNGDEWRYGYDSINRLRLQSFRSGADEVAFSYRYNENGQRMAMGTAPTYGVTEYGEAMGDVWSVPELDGRDEVGRLLKVTDSDLNTTVMAYDVEGRCSQLSHPNQVSDLFGYDIVGKLLSIRVEHDSELLMQMDYSYNLGQDRIGQNTDQDTFIYLTDDAGRLVEECHNRFCIDHERVWKQGSWDRVDFDHENGVLRLLELGDAFSDDRFKAQRWTLIARRQPNYEIPVPRNTLELDNVGLEVRQDGGLRVAYPRGFSNNAIVHQAMVHDYYGQDFVMPARTGPGTVALHGGLDRFEPEDFFAELRHAEKLVGDFDIACDYESPSSPTSSGSTSRSGCVVTRPSQRTHFRLGDPEDSVATFCIRPPSTSAVPRWVDELGMVALSSGDR